jgi:hypothetical protein
MKNFLTKLMLFLLPIVLAGGLAEGALRAIPNDYATKAKAVIDKAESLEVLFFGSSHTLYGIDPSVMSVEGYNLAHPSQSLDLDYRLYQRFAPQLPQLTTVVITVSSFSLFSTLATGLEQWRLANYAMYYDLDLPWSLENQTELFSNAFKTSALKLWRYYVSNQNPIRINDFGFQAKPASTTLDFTGSAILAASRHTYTDWSALEQQTQALTEFVAAAIAKGQRVILLIPPATAAYVERISTAQMTKTREILEGLAESNPLVTVLDLLSDDRFELSDFYDADHLNQQGAHKLSKLLESVILAP